MDIENQATAAENALSETRAAIQAVSNCSRDQQPKQISACERCAKRTKDAFDSYRLEMRTLSDGDQSKHRMRLKQLEDGLKTCRTQIEWKKFELTPAETTPSQSSAAASGPVEPSHQMTLEQAVATAEQTQNESAKSLSRTKTQALQAKEIGNKTLEKLYENDEQLARIACDVDDIQENIKQSKKVMRQIAKGAAHDRCIQILCALITLAVMIMVCLFIVGKDGSTLGNLNLPDQVQQKGRSQGRL